MISLFVFAENANYFADFSFISPKLPTISPESSIISPNAKRQTPC
jgi:hypothetical protein